MLRSIFTFIGLIVFSTLTYAQSVTIQNLRSDYKVEPVGLDSRSPKFSWELLSVRRNVLQVAYQVLVSDNLNSLNADKGNIWDSKKIQSGMSVQVKYDGISLNSATKYYWKVRVWDNAGNVSPWSSVASWRTGLFENADWKNAQWIAFDKIQERDVIVPALHGKGPKDLKPANDVLPLFRKPIVVKSKLKSATAYVCGLGYFEFSINGAKVGDHIMEPGWTKYDKEAQYVSFDVTSRLKAGKNALGVMLGNSFYYLPRDSRYRKLTGAYGYPKLRFLLKLEYTNGAVEYVNSDTTWKTSASPITYSSVYGGEDYDARLVQDGWNTVSYDAKKWKAVVTVEGSPALYSQVQEPIKIFDQFSPVKITKVGEGSFVYDMGQNTSAIPQIVVSGHAGDSIRITPGELLAEDGSVSQKSTGKPAYFTYILRGKKQETWQARFTYYGCRYYQIDRITPKDSVQTKSYPVLHSFKSLHIRNAAPAVGVFHSSSDLFNKTNTLIDWAERSNMVSIFTDCPHRERLGWLEQNHLMGNSIRYNYDIYNLCRKVLRDIKAGQTGNGLIPGTVPEYTVMDFANGVFRDSPEWGSTGVILPWYLYKWYGDKDVLAENYDVMKRYVKYLSSKADNYIISYGLSDWYDIGPERSGFSQLTPMGVTATAYYFYDLKIMSDIARLLGKSIDADEYAHLAEQVKDAFNEKFFDKTKAQYGTGSQSANAIAVYMGLVDSQYKNAVVENIIKDIRAKKNSLTAGDIGFRYLVQVLQREGYSNVLYEMNSNPAVPGYGYQLAQGATALTESWVASKQVSNNHFMLGHLQEWLYGGLGGLEPQEDAVAFNKILIKPELVGDVTSASVKHLSPYGLIDTKWSKTQSRVVLDVSVPANATAIIALPCKVDSRISEGKEELKSQQGMTVYPYENGRVNVAVGSGVYHFVIENK